MGSPKRLGILGGSFDPPHVGHLFVAHDALSSLALDQLIVIPAAQQPLKHLHQTSAEHRLAMVERCFGGIDRMAVDPIEIERGGLSFMVDTVETLQRRWPAAQFHVLIGEDVVATLPQWREPERLCAMATVVVLRREDQSSETTSSQVDMPGLPVQYMATRRVSVSSTEIRDRIRSGRSIRGFVTDAVAEYIVSTGLYLRDSSAGDVSART